MAPRALAVAIPFRSLRSLPLPDRFFYPDCEGTSVGIRCARCAVPPFQRSTAPPSLQQPIPRNRKKLLELAEHEVVQQRCGLVPSGVRVGVRAQRLERRFTDILIALWTHGAIVGNGRLMTDPLPEL